ncbi:MAG: sulfatase [Candidatus Paceibacteria bacterium]
MGNQRNIILVTADSVRADHCGFMGYDRNTTPTIDKMADEGIVFNNAIAAGVPSLPSLFSMYTGEFYPYDPANAFSNRNEVTEELSFYKTLPEYFKERGYNTIGISTNGYMSKYFGFDRGYDVFREFLPTFPDEETDKNIKLKNILGTKIAQGIRGLSSNINSILRNEDLIVGWKDIYPEIKNEMELMVNSDKPFFAHIFLVDSHTPYRPDSIYWGPNRLNSSIRKFYHTIYLQYLKSKRIRGKNATMPDFYRRRIIDCYDDSIRSIDSFVKRLWKDTEESNPLLIFHSDHGESFGEKGYFEHPPKLHEELIHVPLVIYNDGDKEVNKPVSLRDLKEIILSTSNKDNRRQEYPNENSSPWTFSFVKENNQANFAVRTENYKYLYKDEEDSKLYNLNSQRSCKTTQENIGSLGEQLEALTLTQLSHNKEISSIKAGILDAIEGEL